MIAQSDQNFSVEFIAKRVIQGLSEEGEQDLGEDQVEDLLAEIYQIAQNPIDLQACKSRKLLAIPSIHLALASQICSILRAKPEIDSHRELRDLFDDPYVYHLFVALSTFETKETRQQDQFQWKNQVAFDQQNRRGYLREKYQGNKIFSKQSISGITRGGVRISLLLEKDAGESLSLASNQFGYDYVTSFVNLSPTSSTKIILGDFDFKAGSGLLFGSPSFSSPTQALRITRNLSSLKGKASSSENRAQRGLGISSSWRALKLNLGLSRRTIDASLDSDRLGNQFITSFGSTGLHRTTGELSRRKTAQRSAFILSLGLEKWMDKKHVAVNLSLLEGRWSLPWASSKRADLSGIADSDRFGGLSLASSAHWSKIFFQGEIARSMNQSVAGNAGLKYAGRRLSLSASFRNYSPKYFSPFAGAYDRSGIAANNERGLLYFARLRFLSGFSLKLALDHFASIERTYFQTSPIQVKDLHAHLEKKGDGKNTLRLRLRKRIFSIPLEDLNENLVQADLRVRRSLSSRLLWTSSFYWKKFQEVEVEDQQGLLLSTDLAWTSNHKLFSLGYRTFKVDSYDARIFNYEANISDYFYIPAYSGRGYRFYTLISFNPTPSSRLEAKWSLWKYTDRNSISSGNQEIEGNIHSNIRIQTSLQF